MTDKTKDEYAPTPSIARNVGRIRAHYGVARAVAVVGDCKSFGPIERDIYLDHAKAECKGCEYCR